MVGLVETHNDFLVDDVTAHVVVADGYQVGQNAHDDYGRDPDDHIADEQEGRNACASSSPCHGDPSYCTIK